MRTGRSSERTGPRRRVKVRARRELLARPADVWAFVSEPHNLPDWWPGIAGVHPDEILMPYQQ